MNPEKLYATRRDWQYHELQIHRRHWVCEECDAHFATAEGITDHFEALHPEFAGEHNMKILLELSERVMDDAAVQICPFCDEDLRLGILLTHMAQHMEDLALFALPRFVPDEDENAGSRLSHVAGVARSQSSRRGLESAATWSSTREGQAGLSENPRDSKNEEGLAQARDTGTGGQETEDEISRDEIENTMREMKEELEARKREEAGAKEAEKEQRRSRGIETQEVGVEDSAEDELERVIREMEEAEAIREAEEARYIALKRAREEAEKRDAEARRIREASENDQRLREAEREMERREEERERRRLEGTSDMKSVMEQLRATEPGRQAPDPRREKEPEHNRQPLEKTAQRQPAPKSPWASLPPLRQAVDANDRPADKPPTLAGSFAPRKPGSSPADLENQKRLMRERAEAARQRRIEEEIREEAERKERLREKLVKMEELWRGESSKKEGR